MSRTIGNTLGASMGQREGSVDIAHTYGFSWNTTGIEEGIRVDIIEASTERPVYLEFSMQIVTAFNGTGDLIITVGQESGGGEFLDSENGDMDPTATAYYPASNAVTKFRVTAVTPIFITFTPQLDTDAGQAVLIVKEIFQNIIPVV